MVAPDFGLDGKRILVLGGGQGMGESTSRLLAAAGAHVAVADLEAERAERVAAAVGGHPLVVDVTDDDALVAAIARTEAELGPLDGLVTIIGMAAWARLTDMTTEIWDLDHRRNLRYFFIAAARWRVRSSRATRPARSCASRRSTASAPPPATRRTAQRRRGWSTW